MQGLFPEISLQKEGLTGVPCRWKGVDCVKFSSVAPKVLKNAVRIQVFIHNIYIDAKCS